MPNIYDIPKKLLNPDKKDEFIGWVKRIPAEDWVKRDLARAWSQATTTPLGRVQYIKMGL